MGAFCLASMVISMIVDLVEWSQSGLKSEGLRLTGTSGFNLHEQPDLEERPFSHL